MRRTILVLAAVALMLAMVGSPAAAIPKDYVEWDTWCDMDGDGLLDTYFVQVAAGVPGWSVEPAVHAPSIFLGGYGEVWDDGEFAFSVAAGDPPRGMASRVTYCIQEATWTMENGVERHVIWDPLWLFFPPPAIP